MPQYKYSRDDYYRLTNAPCLDVARALGMEINERESDRKSWKIKGEQGLCIYREGNNWYRFSDGRHGFSIDLVIDKLGCSREQALDFIAKNVVNGVSEHPEISSVWFSFDNDEGGRNGAASSKEKLLHDFPDRQLKVHICYPTHGKDWNEDLQQFRQVEPEGMSVREYVGSDSNSYFSYHGFHFQPVGILPPGNTLSDIAQDISSIPEMGYNDEFSYADFIRANTTGKNADIFRCIESNQLCLPGENELYAYTGEYLSTFHVQTAQEEQPDDDECEMEIG